MEVLHGLIGPGRAHRTLANDTPRAVSIGSPGYRSRMIVDGPPGHRTPPSELDRPTAAGSRGTRRCRTGCSAARSGPRRRRASSTTRPTASRSGTGSPASPGRRSPTAFDRRLTETLALFAGARPDPALLADAGVRRAGRPRRPPARRRIRGSRRRDADGARPGPVRPGSERPQRRSPGQARRDGRARPPDRRRPSRTRRRAGSPIVLAEAFHVEPRAPRSRSS